MPSLGENLRPEVFLRFDTANKKSSLLGLELAARNLEKAHSIVLLEPTKIRRDFTFSGIINATLMAVVGYQILHRIARSRGTLRN